MGVLSWERAHLELVVLVYFFWNAVSRSELAG
ncbi:hypothetical protein A2U01_0086198, partial [Trifolium medium]|nr:hypothetical protein [Trifolium medium]